LLENVCSSEPPQRTKRPGRRGHKIARASRSPSKEKRSEEPGEHGPQGQSCAHDCLGYGSGK